MTTAAELVRRVLEAEHAAVYGYGVLGARLAGDGLRLARSCADGHRARRDQLAERLRASGSEPPAPAAAYDVTITTPADAVALAVRLEEGVALRWRDLVGGTRQVQLRGLAVAGLRESAVRAAQWRVAQGAAAPTRAFPGEPAPAAPSPAVTPTTP